MSILAPILAVALVGCGSHSERTPSAGSISVSSDGVHQIVESARLHRGARGGLAVLRDSGATWHVASGTADDAGSPLTTDMRFRIGSITKPIIAALALDQVRQGTMALDRDITDLVGPPLRATPPVSLRNLLTHTSGVFDIGNEGDPIADIELLTDEGLVTEARALLADSSRGQAVIASDRLTIGLAETHDRYFQPGAGFHYSNTNYQVVGVAMGRVTGQTLDELLRDRITAPLGLTLTSIAPSDRSTPDVHGFVTDRVTGAEVDVTGDLLAFGNGASGGILSTADELLAIMTEIVHGSLLPADLRIRMQTPTRQSGGTYGLGLGVYELSCGRFLGHEGRVNGTVSVALVDAEGPERAFVAAFNSTDDQTGLVELAERVLCRSEEPDAAQTSGG